MHNGRDETIVNKRINVVNVTNFPKTATMFLKQKTSPFFQICVIQRRDMEAPVDSSCLEVTEVSQKTQDRLGLSNQQVATDPPVVEGDIEELLKSIER